MRRGNYIQHTQKLNKHIKDIHATMSDKRTFAELHEGKFEEWLSELLDRLRDKPSVQN